MIQVEKNGIKTKIPIEKLHEWTHVPYLPTLQFSSLSLLKAIQKKGAQLEVEGELTMQQSFLGKYFQKEILESRVPPVSLRWINDRIGWGVFAEAKIAKMDFIAEYSGTVRKRLKSDRRNSYCFEYLLAYERATRYNIDARGSGGLARYINHSTEANLETSLATFKEITHVILYAKREIFPGEQLLYDYGENYWKYRGGEEKLHFNEVLT